MKIRSIILLCCLFVCAPVILNAQKVKFFKGTWAEANEKAAKEGKYIMVDAYTEWCYWCKVMDKKTFTDPQVADFINEHFVPMKLDFEKDEGVKLAMKFRVSSYPTTLLFNTHGQLVVKHPGYIADNQKFIEMLQGGLDVQEERIFGFDSRELDLDYPEFLYGVYGANGKKKFPKRETVEAWVNEQEDLSSELVWCVAEPRGAGPKMEAYFIENYAKFKKKYGKVDAEGFIQTILYNKMEEAKKANDDSILEDAVAISKLLEERQRVTELVMLSMHYQEKGDLEKFAAKMDEMAADHAAGMEFYINDVAWEVFEKNDEEWLVKKAIEWMHPVVKNVPTDYATLDTYAALYYKDGQYGLAEKWATNAIHQGKQAGEDVKETEVLLEKIRAAKADQ